MLFDVIVMKNNDIKILPLKVYEGRRREYTVKVEIIKSEGFWALVTFASICMANNANDTKPLPVFKLDRGRNKME